MASSLLLDLTAKLSERQETLGLLEVQIHGIESWIAPKKEAVETLKKEIASLQHAIRQLTE